jgi:hypothetical protein
MVAVALDDELVRRQRAAVRYKPDRVDLLLVAEAPPEETARYFYFEDVREHDALFRYICRGVLKREATRENKRELLSELRDRGVFLIDLKETPWTGGRHRDYLPALVGRCHELEPRRIILIKAPVFDAAYQALVDAGLPVVDVRIPFPASGRQREFERAFERALSVVYESDI